MTQREQLKNLRRKGHLTQAEAFRFFDSLEPIEPEALQGVWKGTELPSGHPMDGILTACGWYGKRFVDQETVDPLLFRSGRTLFAADAGRLPIQSAENLPRWLVRYMRPLICLLFRTRKSGARLRTIRYRGKETAAMFYDKKPIIDIFSRIDGDTIIGVTDTKWDHAYGCFFILERTGSQNGKEV